jgi:hypothetical protein
MVTFGNSDRSTEESSRSAVSWAAIVAAAAASGLTIVLATLGSGLDSRRSHLGPIAPNTGGEELDRQKPGNRQNADRRRGKATIGGRASR